ncbi:N5-glutamine methyltransferase family protein [Paenibacillus sp. GCM10023252]|uniref:N5-glutamine methyltransferase family protein n=1 Tax=Paenibacillus sp. GCM10023252 TaxID=3252649 RepID=UPI0036107420
MIGIEDSFQPPLTLREACLQASSLLAGQGVEEPRSNSELLLMHLLGIDRAVLLRDGGERVPEDRLAEWRALVARKAAGEPIQYIIGEGWFYGRPFTVAPAVLIPRPETELLVEAVMEAADRLWPGSAGGAEGAAGTEGGGAARAGAEGAAGAEAGGAAGVLGQPAVEAVPTVLDVGTGSGAIAVTLAAQRPGWRLCASDLSPDALAVARTNAVRHGAADRIQFVQGDLLAPFLRRRDSGVNTGDGGWSAAGLAVDVLVSNPPYIPADDLPGLQREVRDFEPRLALDGGADGLDPYRRMAAQLPELAQLPRIVGFELGMGQAREVAALLQGLGHWDEVRVIQDYAGIERHVLAVRSNA